jgi:hypothetical protein
MRVSVVTMRVIVKISSFAVPGRAIVCASDMPVVVPSDMIVWGVVSSRTHHATNVVKLPVSVVNWDWSIH